MTSRDRQLDRLAKLLALARSPNVHEAESAKRAAGELMRRHGLGAEEASGRLASGYYEHPLGARFHQAWRFALATAAARHCGAEAVGLWVGQKCKVRIAGVRSDVERAVALYERLLELVLDLGRRVDGVDESMRLDVACSGLAACKDSFRRGVVVALVVLMARSAGEPLFQGVAAPRGRGLSRELARVDDRSSRVRESYQPDERPLDLDDAEAPAWYEAGIATVRRWVVVGEDGEPLLRCS
jgi:hypothetical protein